MISFKAFFMLLCGLGFFIYGLQLMGNALEKTVGGKLRHKLEALTSNRLLGIVSGAGIAALIQSSSAATVMVLGFVNAGLMSLPQAASVIIGANIGTTITSQIIAFDLYSAAPVIAAAGAAITLFSKSKKVRDFGEIIFGFGLMYVGFMIMGSSAKDLQNIELFRSVIESIVSSPAIALLTGILLTALIRSSSAFIAVIMAVAAAGTFGIGSFVPLILGSNIGTCISAILASKGTGKNAKRTALIHLTFNIVGVIIFSILSNPLINLVALTGGSIERQIANTHLLFNLVNAVIQYPLIIFLVKLTTIIIKGNDEKVQTTNLEYIDTRFLETPSVAVSQVLKELVRMAQLSYSSVKESLQCFMNYSESLAAGIYDREELIDYLETEITRYLVQLSNSDLSEQESKIITSLFHVINDIERIGDHAENLVELAEYKVNHMLKFSEEAATELKYMYETVLSSLEYSIYALEKMDVENAEKTITLEDSIDRLQRQLRSDHINRLNKGICLPANGAVFLDAISNLERVGDHSNNIAEIVVDIAE